MRDGSGKPLNKQRDIILVFGKTGMGKTRWTVRELKNRRRVLILDPVADDPYVGLVVQSMKEAVDYVEEYPSFRLRTDRIDWLRDLCLLALAAGNTTAVLDEASRYLTPRTNLELIAPEFLDIVYRGRHTATSLIIVAQRASTVNIAARSQWTRIITFRQSEPADLHWLQDQAGEALNLNELQIGEYFDITPKGTQRLTL